jgi:methionyl-tRNA formyltransferase
MIAVLTTETPHHAYFVSALKPDIVFCETGANTAAYATAHDFENARDKYERQVWFDGADKSLGDFSTVERFEDIGDAATRLKACDPDLAICFGTRRLKPPILTACGDFLNLHGGDPQEYRGLDTHLWAIWHRDFDGLKTCLHRVNPVLDDGEVVALAAIPLSDGMKLHQLRKANTEVCIELVQSVLARGVVESRPQRKKGRYYGAMPSVLKEVCVKRFERWTTQRASAQIAS